MMSSTYGPPHVSGVTEGVLNLYLTPEPIVTVTYDPIEAPHTVSVLWEVTGPHNKWVYCCELNEQPAGAPALLNFTPRALYSNEHSAGNSVRVRYSIAVAGAPAEFSPYQEFEVVRGEEKPPEPGGSPQGLALRETIEQWTELSGTFIQYVDILTDAIGEDATVYAHWPNMEFKPRWLTWDKPQDPGDIWHGESVAPQDGLGIFKIPKKQLLRLDQQVGVLTVTDGEDSNQPLYVAVNMSGDETDKLKAFELASGSKPRKI